MTPSAADGPHEAQGAGVQADFYRSGRLPFLVAAAAILQISESMLPHPVPGLRFGLANIVALIVLVRYGWRPALTITMLRTVVSSVVLGTFLSPGFILSFCGGCVSMLTVSALHQISQRVPLLRISPVGLGMAGAFAHNMVQLGLAYVMLVRHPGLFFLIPWLSFGSVALGAFSGALALGVLNRLAANPEPLSLAVRTAAPLQNRVYRSADTWLHRCPPETKIATVLIVTLTTVLVENLYFYGALFALILILIPAASLAYRRVFLVLRRLWVIVISAFLLPLYFNAGSEVLLDTVLGPLHREAVVSACIFSLRIVLLALVSNLVAQTTDGVAFSRGLRTYLKVFDRLGLDSRSLAETLTLSLTALPTVWVEIRSVLGALMAGRRKDLKTVNTVIVQLFCYLFAEEGHKNGRPRSGGGRTGSSDNSI